MLKYKVITFILLAAVFSSGQAFCQQAVNGPQIITVAGKVDKTDPDGGVIKVRTKEGMMIFSLSVRSDLFRETHHISAIEIEKGDPVIIQYISSSPVQNEIIRLVDNKPSDY